MTLTPPPRVQGMTAAASPTRQSPVLHLRTTSITTTRSTTMIRAATRNQPNRTFTRSLHPDERQRTGLRHSRRTCPSVQASACSTSWQHSVSDPLCSSLKRPRVAAAPCAVIILGYHPLRSLGPPHHPQLQPKQRPQPFLTTGRSARGLVLCPTCRSHVSGTRR
uniref:Uncharacterized protein n=1 Tax=Cacopsylla melanoneura TaxID=428564 RepID=A0A8D9E981_9HEMI